MYRIINVKDYSGGIEKAARYIHDKWGSDGNYAFYLDAIMNSSSADKSLPKFFLMLKQDEVVGCFALITNDFISRHDLIPWFACLFVEERERGNKLSQRMFDYARLECKKAGYEFLYLTTDHEALYERFGWERIEDGYEPTGKKTRIYRMTVSASV